jgi:hypothetical protein
MDTHLPQYASSPRAIMWARSVQVQVRQSPTVRREGAPTAANAHRQSKEIARRPTRCDCEILFLACDLGRRSHNARDLKLAR